MNRYSSINSNFVYNLFKNKGVITKLILVNVSIFVVIGLIEVIFTLFKLPIGVFHQYITLNLSISAIPSEVIVKPWTLITYMFMHSRFFHILVNMLMLYWFGRIFTDFLGNKKLFDVYISGGLAGALIYLIAYQTIPLLSDNYPLLGMVGASASVIAIIIATATYFPNYSVFLLFFGQVKLKYLAIVLVVIDVLSLKDGNTGGHFAHLGGALFGFIYAYQLKKGIDIGKWVSGIIDFFTSIGKKTDRPRKVKFKVVSDNEPTVKYTTKPSVKNDEEQVKIDKILDKIAKSGYDSLSTVEKDLLFNASKK